MGLRVGLGVGVRVKDRGYGSGQGSAHHLSATASTSVLKREMLRQPAPTWARGAGLVSGAFVKESAAPPRACADAGCAACAGAPGFGAG